MGCADTTNDQGRFEIAGLAPGKFLLSAARSHFADGTQHRWLRLR